MSFQDRLTHFNEQERAKMVDITEKESTLRVAVAHSKVTMSPETLARIKSGQMEKGDVLAVAQIAGIMARRITSYPQVGDHVNVGDELGFIKLGSRCDVFLPVDCAVHVRLQQKVKGGETILALWKPG